MSDESFFSTEQLLTICRERWGAERLPHMADVMNDTWPERLPVDFDHLLLDGWGLSRQRYVLIQEVGGWRVWSIEELAKRICDPETATTCFKERWEGFCAGQRWLSD